MVRVFLEDDDIEASCRVPITEILEVPEGGFPRVRGGRTDDAGRLYSTIQAKIQSAAVMMPAGRAIAVAGLFDRRPMTPAPAPAPEPSTIGVGVKRRPEGTRPGAASAAKEARKNSSSNSSSNSNSSGVPRSRKTARRRTTQRHRR
jgi:hypothetical protein